MPRSDRPIRVPKYCHHKPTNRAFVKLNGKFHYLGRYGTEDSRAAYERLIARWLQNGRNVPDDTANAISIEELLIGYYRFAVDYYTDPETGEASTELDGIRIALGVVRRLFAGTKAADFGPLALKECRTDLVNAGYVRKNEVLSSCLHFRDRGGLCAIDIILHLVASRSNRHPTARAAKREAARAERSAPLKRRLRRRLRRSCGED